ncbi:MAG: hypothetical protein U9Q68_09710 [Euryarchaeota archaeon]|nr:hypothetical protein [Euryarchaeota archaeon]
MVTWLGIVFGIGSFGSTEKSSCGFLLSRLQDDSPIPTSILLRTHTTDPVPFAICGHEADSVSAFDERSAAAWSYGLKVGSDLVGVMIED